MKTTLFISISLAVFFLVSSKPAGKKSKDATAKQKLVPEKDLGNVVNEMQPMKEPEGANEPNEDKSEGGKIRQIKVEEEDREEQNETSTAVDENIPLGPATEREEDEEAEAELNPNIFEGDLKLSLDEINELKENTISKKDAVSDKARRWPKGRIPYVIDKSFDGARRKVLMKAISIFNKKTCVKFRHKKKKDKDYIRFVAGIGCFSTGVGKCKQGGEQVISIGEGCNYLGTFLHEMMHAIGFFHEHTRLDRDKYITINWGDVMQGRETQFQKYNHGEGDYLGEPYDYSSVMHYPRHAFGVSVDNMKLPTIVPKEKPWQKIGQRMGLSDIDLRQINKLYNCKKFTKAYGGHFLPFFDSSHRSG